MILIDSNIWAYYFDTSLNEHRNVVKPVETSLKKEQAVVNVTIVLETYHYLVKRLGPLVGGEKARIFSAFGMPLYPLDVATVETKLRKLCEFTHLGIGGRDASILATMELESISQIMTHDQSFKRIPDIKVIDPV